MSKTIGTSIDDADSSPLGFQYFGNWGLGSPLVNHYSNTAHYSQTPGSQAILFFRGSSIIYYADRHSSLGLVNVYLDGFPAPDTVNLTSASALFRQPVWSKNVSEGDHQVVIQHAGPARTNIMIDYVTIQSEGGSTSTRAGPAASEVSNSAVVLNNTDPRMDFSPNNWRYESEGLFYSRGRWLTQSPGASVQFTFNGTAIWYFSDTNDNHGSVRIRVDGDDGEIASGYSSTPLAQRLIWSKTDLDPGTHTINLTHEDTDGRYLTLDFFRYLESPPPDADGKKVLNAGAIAGIVIAGLFLLGIIFCVFIRWATPRYWSDTEEQDPDAPPPYRPADSSSRSSIATSDRRYINDIAPLQPTIPMGQAANNPVTYTPIQDTTQSGTESLLSTPAQRYRDSSRALLASARTSRNTTGMTASPQMGRFAASAPDLHSGLNAADAAAPGESATVRG